jgi:hypothetical protein
MTISKALITHDFRKVVEWYSASIVYMPIRAGRLGFWGGGSIPGGKVKVKLLCLTKHHAMKTYWRVGGIAPRILDLGTRWR